MSERLKKAETLFLAIGTVDDALVNAAITPPRAKRFTPFRIAAVSAAAVLLIAFSVFGVGVLNRLFAVVNMPSEERAHLSLRHTMAEAAESESVTKTKAEDINFFSGNASIIWQEKGDSEYCVVGVSSKTDAVRIKGEIGKHSLNPPENTSDDCKLWISYGDGRVVSPYLKASAGNVGYAELFDYAAEVYPSEELMELVNDLIAQEA